MEKLITHNANALRFLMTEDLYNLGDAVHADVLPLIQDEVPAKQEFPISGHETIKAGAQPVSFDYLGDNNKYFLIIVNDKSHTSLNTAHKDMLMKIMAAKKFELRDLAILNLANYPDTNFSDLKDFFSCNRMALFGIDPQRIGLQAMSSNQPGKHQDVKVLATFGLEEMSSSIDKKREFWNIMKDF